MKTLIEIHVLQNYAPSNLNRDDTGSPKDAFFGGRRRARISSQCLKRAVREYFKEKSKSNLFDTASIAVRTKRLQDDLIKLLVEKGRDKEEAIGKINLALKVVKLIVGDDGKTQYLLFLGKKEIESVANAIYEHWDDIVPSVEAEEKTNKKKKKKGSEADGLPEELKTALEKAFDGGKAVDLALFGRMLADMPEKNQNAASQVAHAISTHAVDREFDFFTALDDLKPEESAGSDMMGTVEFNSACFYRYAVVDFEKLVENLHADESLASAGLRTFLEGFVVSEPTGKQNTFAAHNQPDYVLVSIKRNSFPSNCANAFEVPVRVKGDDSLTKESTKKLVNKMQKLIDVYGNAGKSFYFDLVDVGVGIGEKSVSLQQLLDKVIAEVEKGR
ncbi:MAG: type I-E CRISPR-associated protein Cas7/Cse4/CasC [Candidatus Omnitrophota bacterium]